MTVLKARIGGVWVPLTGTAQPWNSAWGVMAGGTLPATGGKLTVVAGGGADAGIMTATLVAGRRYTLRYYARAIGADDASSAVIGYFQLWVDGGLAGDPDGVTNPYWRSVAQWTHAVIEFSFDCPQGRMTAGTHQLVCRLNNPSNAAITTWQDGSTYWRLFDIGPVNQAPAIPNPTPAWAALPLANGATTDTRQARYRRIGDIVYLEGLVVRGSTDVIATLPVGYRPPKQRWFVGWSGSLGNANIGADGTVNSNNAYIFIDGWSFSITP